MTPHARPSDRGDPLWTAQSRPWLTGPVILSVTDEHLSIESGSDVFEVSCLCPVSSVFTAVREMYGDRTVAEIAVLSGLEPCDLLKLTTALEADGLVAMASGPDAHQGLVDREEFSAFCRREFVVWKQRLFSHPLWTGLADGSASRPLFIGWLIENYHFIEAVTLRLPLVIAHCANPAARRHFTRHFAEEFDHHHFFQRALDAAGITKDRLRSLRPLPATAGVINHLRDCARRDYLSYAACSGFLESTGQDHERTRDFFGCVAAYFDSAGAPIVKPLADHAALDECYGHCGMLDLIIETMPSITRAHADQAVADVYALVETLELWSTDMMRHYAVPGALDELVRSYRPLSFEGGDHE